MQQPWAIPWSLAFHMGPHLLRTVMWDVPSSSRNRASVSRVSRVKLNVVKEAVAGKADHYDRRFHRARNNSAPDRKYAEANAGAKEVHVRISAPPFLWPCYFGTDIPAREQLIAYNRSIEDIRDLIGADSLGYLRIERLKEMVSGLPICEGCFTGTYPLAPPTEDIRGEYER